MAVSGADSAKVNRVLTTTLDAYINKVIVNDLARNDAIVGMFGANGRIRVQTGGERAIYTIDDVENPNFGWRDKLTDIPTSQNDSRKQAKYAFATLDGKTLPILAVMLIKTAIKFRETLTDMKNMLMAILSETRKGTCRDYNIATLLG